MNTPSTAATRPHRVVLVNDSITQCKALARMLGTEQFTIELFTDAETALTTMNGHPLPDIIITDLYMPGIDGWRFCRLLRSPEFAAFNQIPILVVSATFSGDDTGRITVDTGADAFLALPVGTNDLRQAVTSLLAGEQHAHHLRVLIVEDSKTLALLLKKTFISHGYITDLAHTLAEAEQLNRQNSYDVAVIDYHLPDGRGDHLLDTIRRKQAACACILMTSDPQPHLALQGMKQGASVYLRKPFDPAYLIELCRKARREQALLKVEDLLDLRTRELQQSEATLRSFVENSPIGLFRNTPGPQGRFAMVNLAMARMHGFETVEELMQYNVADLYMEPSERDQFSREIAQKGVITSLERAFKRKDGKPLWGSITARAVYDPDGQMKYIEGTCVDITESKKAKAALVDMERRLAQIVDFLPYATFAIDHQKRVIIWNRGIETLTGVPASNMLGRGDHAYTVPFYGEPRPHLMDLLWEDDPATLAKYPFVHREGKFLKTEVFCHALYGGKGAWLACKAAPLYDSTGRIIGAIEALVDITERMETQEALRESERSFRQLFDSVNDLVYTQDVNGRFTRVNQAFERCLGYPREAFMGRRASDFMRARYQERFDTEYLEMIQKTGQRQGIAAFLTRNGQKTYVEYNSTLVQETGQEAFISGTGRDVSERIQAEKKIKRLMAQMLQAQKMEAVGTLAGGIAHDFNNILQAISGFTQLLLMRRTEQDPDYKALLQINNSTDRASRLVRQLLLFSRKMEGEQRPLNLNLILRETEVLLKRTLPKMVAIDIITAPGLSTVSADPVQMEQILLNLSSNAADAMPEGGRLIIETANITLTSEYCDTHLGAQPGQYVMLAVSDTGCGIPKEARPHIFNPFYTTKEVGKGTGLGLASVYGVVKSHNGYISCYSEVGQGTTFKIYLPVIEAAAQTPEPALARPSLPPGGIETILVVDDEPDVRDSVAAMLSRLGYTLTTAASGEEALTCLRQQPKPPDLVILDLGMPGMGGHKCLDALLQRHPQLKVLIASGYSANGHARQALEAGAAGFVSKPWQFADLAVQIRKVLDEPVEGNSGTV